MKYIGTKTNARGNNEESASLICQGYRLTKQIATTQEAALIPRD